MQERSWSRLTRVLFGGLFTILSVQGAISVALSPSQPSGPVGTLIRFSATAKGADSLWYRFRARKVGADFKLIRDYGPFSSLDWTADQEGSYEMEVFSRDLISGDVAMDSVTVALVPVVTGQQPAISLTANELVFLYSAPACSAGQRMRVEFQSPDLVTLNTPYKNCKSGVTMNFYLAGLRANTAYVARHRLDTGTQFSIGPDVPFTTGDIRPGLYVDTVIQPSPANGNASQPVLLGGPLFSTPVAHDLSGNVIWYGPRGDFTTTRPEPDGRFWGITEDFSDDPALQTIRKFDLAGMTLLETNAARVSEQLRAQGKRPISSFHHEVRTLPDGRIAALAAVEQILTDVQGPGPVDVIGDMIVVFDSNLNVVWTWDTFDNLDPHRAATLGEQCIADSTCPPYALAKDANDWTHGNTIAETPDGHLLYSSRHQDWVIKISYDAGEGDGHIIWKLGKDGDFQFLSTETYPWFSHQHDTDFDPSDPTRLLVFDNGNTRVIMLNQGYSRGQVLQLDESNRTATLVVNADVGIYSLALGSAQKLSNGNYHFDFGYVIDPSGPDAYSVEVDAAGNMLYNAKAGTPLYRSFRMTDIYTPN